ncbi:MAG TPA: hypothetical protein VLB27_07185, partial [candidate division Zixibacteria bacterium]|nr:hypothetical protein [candidate division Zixibacteria bacterium]
LVIPNATVAVDSMMLPYVAADRLYEKQYLSADSIARGSHRLTIDAQGLQILNQNLVMTDTFTAEVIVPFNKLYTGGLQVQVGLNTASLNAQGYVVAVVPRDSVYMGKGYAEFVPLTNPVGNIPPDVFRDPLFPDSLLEGVWYIYMYAYRGSPQIDGVTDDLPAALPDTGFTPNLSLSDISGSVGAILVSKRDTLVVQKQP